MKATIAGAIILIIIAAAGWYFYSTRPPMTAPPSAQTSTNATTTPIIGYNLALGVDGTPQLGNYLIGYTGMTVYTYDEDAGNQSNCYDQCAQEWPPYIVSPVDDIHQLQMGVTGTVGTTVRSDGSLQLTYDGHPLYFYSGDKTGDDTAGNGVGGTWHVVKP